MCNDYFGKLRMAIYGLDQFVKANYASQKVNMSHDACFDVLGTTIVVGPSIRKLG